LTIFSLSDIAVLGAGRFIVSNTFRWSNRWLQLLEFLTQREYGSLLMYDGKQAISLARYSFSAHQTLVPENKSFILTNFSGLQTPNGLFWEPETRRLFVALTNAEVKKHCRNFIYRFQIVKVYNVKQDMQLVEQTQINLMSSPDQLYFQKSSGELWVTAHPITYQLLNLIYSDFQSQSAFHVLRVRFQVNFG
jgi:hypothetical protein